MKKVCYILLASLLILVLSPLTSFANDLYYDYFKVVKLVIGEKQAQVNNQQATLEQPAYVKDGRTLVPFRFLGESLGATVNWDSVNRQATLQLGDKAVKVTLGSKVAYVDGKLTNLEVAPESKGGKTFIPLRFVSEALGAYVDYNSDTAEIMIRYVDTQGWEEYTFSGETEPAYMYPADWEVTKDDKDIPTFISPRGSEVSDYWIEDNMYDLIEEQKTNCGDYGLTFISKEPIYPDNPGYGVLMIFMVNTSNPKDRVYNYSYLIALDKSNTRVVDEYFAESDLEMDGPVATEIVGGY